MLNLAPKMIRRYPRFQDYDLPRLCGLEFARVYGVERDRISFGIGVHQIELMDESLWSFNRWSRFCSFAGLTLLTRAILTTPSSRSVGSNR
jgi:hypothetical protein